MAMDLTHPYWASDVEKLSFLDFNKEILPPGKRPDHPDGLVAIRVDDNFSIVAVLPYCRKDEPVKDLVAELWPVLMGNPRVRYNPDTYAGGDDE